MIKPKSCWPNLASMVLFIPHTKYPHGLMTNWHLSEQSDITSNLNKNGNKLFKKLTKSCVANHQQASPMTQSTRSIKLIPYFAATTAQTTVEGQ